MRGARHAIYNCYNTRCKQKFDFFGALFLPLAIFDLDETLLSGDSDYAWFQFIIEQGLVDAGKYNELNRRFHREYKEGKLNITAYLEVVCTILGQFDRNKLYSLREQFMEIKIAPMWLPKAIALVNYHRGLDHRLLVITSTLEFIAEPIVRLLGIPHLIAPVPEIIDQRFTGRIVGTASFQQGKVIRLKEWLSQQQLTLAGSYCYTDSHNDLPLLEQVDYPVAVDPDDILRRTADERGWKIISLRDDSRP
jgi:HAD superfamily hydrolase (TIGR01490 family)